jgi:hypothetical protein
VACIFIRVAHRTGQQQQETVHVIRTLVSCDRCKKCLPKTKDFLRANDKSENLLCSIITINVNECCVYKDFKGHVCGFTGVTVPTFLQEDRGKPLKFGNLAATRKGHLPNTRVELLGQRFFVRTKR